MLCFMHISHIREGFSIEGETLDDAVMCIHQKPASHVEKLASSTGAWARGTTSPRPQTARVPSDQTQWQLWQKEALPPTPPTGNWQRFSELFHLPRAIHWSPFSLWSVQAKEAWGGTLASLNPKRSPCLRQFPAWKVQGWGSGCQGAPRTWGYGDTEPPELLPTETYSKPSWSCNIPCNANSSANPLVELQTCNKVPPRHTSSQQSSTAARLSAAPSVRTTNTAGGPQQSLRIDLDAWQTHQ